MDKVIIIVFKNDNSATWTQDEWDDYSYDGKAFIIKKDCEWVGIYNFDSIISIIVKEKK